MLFYHTFLRLLSLVIYSSQVSGYDSIALTIGDTILMIKIDNHLFTFSPLVLLAFFSYYGNNRV